jgi:hexosaminidase
MVNIKRNKQFAASAIFLMLVIGVSCKVTAPSDLTKESLIPKPVSVTSTGDYFKLKKSASIFVTGEDEGIKKVGEYLSDQIKTSTGLELKVVESANESGAGNISLTLSEKTVSGGDESYELSISKDLVRLTAATPEGLFRGVQTLMQLLPVGGPKDEVRDPRFKIATGVITDYPVYSYRGAMLDVSRHFFGVDDVKRLIDLMAVYKMNVLHMGLSNDQGWRIEIKSWPNLALHGGSTQVGGGKGGYYTQEQYSDIVKYARDRFVTIVPEIDMPGHTNAALASYAELNCSGKATELYTGIEVGFSTLCTKKEITYKFIDDVVRELAAITPGPYIHIGGDESHATKIEDYIPFINRVQDIVMSHGKRVIGWDEIALTTLRPQSTAQHWANGGNAKLAVAQGAKILMSPATKAYVDMKYDSTTTLGLHWAAYIEVDSAYIWDPATLVPGVGRENVLGVEAALWSETVTNMHEIEYMVFPRLPGYAEIGWTAPSARSWDEYKLRLAKHGERFTAMGINFYKSPKVPWNTAVK